MAENTACFISWDKVCDILLVNCVAGHVCLHIGTIGHAGSCRGVGTKQQLHRYLVLHTCPASSASVGAVRKSYGIHVNIAAVLSCLYSSSFFLLDLC
jgi:hypothetical protein